MKDTTDFSMTVANSNSSIDQVANLTLNDESTATSPWNTNTTTTTTTTKKRCRETTTTTTTTTPLNDSNDATATTTTTNDTTAATAAAAAATVTTGPFKGLPDLKKSRSCLGFEDTTTRIPMAPSLYEYMKDTSRYVPRPEWCRVPAELSAGQWWMEEDLRIASSASSDVPQPQPLPLPLPQWGRAVAPENGLLTDHSWGGTLPPQRTTPTPAVFVEPLLPYTEHTAVAFVQQTTANRWTLPTTSTAMEEESDSPLPPLPPQAVLGNPSSSEDDASFVSSSQQQQQQSLQDCSRGAVFGKEYNTALHCCIAQGATDAALELIQLGAPLEACNTKGMTPIISAAQKGNLLLVETLVTAGANPVAYTHTGSTALIQASHFGHTSVVEFLLTSCGVMAEQANYKNTTALMRAAQEGHEKNVRLLLRHESRVNRENDDNMTALMLAAQRGHVKVSMLLLRAGAKIDDKTPQGSTSLMLACKRGHVRVAKLLIRQGSELRLRDGRGRSARETAVRKQLHSLIPYMTPQVQTSMMKYTVLLDRGYLFIVLWHLLQQERAFVKVFTTTTTTTDNDSTVKPVVRKHYCNKSIHELAADFSTTTTTSTTRLYCMNDQKRALIQTMMLPIPLVGIIASYIPCPHLWERRLEMLTRRCSIDADCTISCALDLIDEVLEHGGFLEACDSSGITPPSNFESWNEWTTQGNQHSATTTSGYCYYQQQQSRNPSKPTGMSVSLSEQLSLSSSYHHHHHSSETTTTTKKNKRYTTEERYPLDQFIVREEVATKLRRDACFWQLLAHRSPLLTKTLESPPYCIPHSIILKLKNNNDIFSVVRRLGSRGVRFGSNVATEMVLLANQLLLWYHSSDKSGRMDS